MIEEKSKEVYAIFLRWLKNNDLFWLFQRNTHLYAVETFPLSTWVRCIVKGEKCWDEKELYQRQLDFIQNSPFRWGELTEPYEFYEFRRNLNLGTWSQVSSQWQKYLNRLQDKEHIYS